MAQPKIPESIVVHLGSPSADARNVTESFQDYIKNVASSEIYPTWPKEALKANILAQISVALNRVYTEYYRSMGKDFDITNSPAYDQTYVYQRDIYDSISEIVDEIFDSYIRREGNIEPLFAQFCDGIEVTCGGLEQWGSVELANQGFDYISILKNYYGDNIEIVRNVPVENIAGTAPPVAIVLGDTGSEIELIQRKLNRIAVNFPGIPRIENPDGFFDERTLESVKKFQEVFGLTQDGIIGRATWYKIQFIYNGVKKLFEITSEGLRLEDITTAFGTALREGDSGENVLALQYYLSYISLFIPTVLEPGYDGSFGPNTANSVISFQRTYGLEENGIVDRLTWDNIENVYYGILREMDYSFKPGRILPFPGRVLRMGIEGDDVKALQEYLNFISGTYPDIPRINVDGSFGTSTANSVKAFKRQFGYSDENERVTPQIWNAIASIYDDLYYSDSQVMKISDERSDIEFPINPGDSNRALVEIGGIMKEIEEYYYGVSAHAVTSYYSKDTEDTVLELKKVFLMEENAEIDLKFYKRLKDEQTSIRNFR